MRYFLLVVMAGFLSGCSANAIIPAKVTFTYPLQEPFAAFETEAAVGAVAYLDEGSLALYLPHLTSHQSRPTRLVFVPTDTAAIWVERRDPELRLEMIQERRKLSASGPILNEGMLLVSFPDNPRYGQAAGTRVWLTSTTGPDEIFRVRGVYWKSKASMKSLMD